MDGFTFYEDYYETLLKMKKESDRRAVLTAVLDFVFEDKEPQGLSEVAEIVFETFRKSLTKSKNKSKNAKIKLKSNQNQTENKSNQTENKSNQTENKSNQTENKSKQKEAPLKEDPQKDKESNKEKENIYPQESYPQENHSPTAGARVRVEGAACMTCADFLSKYPNIYPDTHIAAYGLDWDLLDEKFQESTKYLRATPHDLSWVKNNYRRIIADVYRDKEDVTGTGYNGMDFFDEITENLKKREGKRNDG